MTVAAFFDMDRTLLRRSSNLLFVRYAVRRRLLGLADLRRVAWIMVRYALGRLDVPTMTRKLVGDMAGESVAERVAFTQRWFQEQLVHYVAEEGRQVLESHRHRGHRVVLITASPSHTALALAQHLQIAADDVLASTFEVRDGLFTGRVVEPLCYGEGKLLHAQAYARRHGLDLAASYFYTDSIRDLPLLEAVGTPVAVNPDGPLGRLARACGWQIVRFY